MVGYQHASPNRLRGGHFSWSYLVRVLFDYFYSGLYRTSYLIIHAYRRAEVIVIKGFVRYRLGE